MRRCCHFRFLSTVLLSWAAVTPGLPVRAAEAPGPALETIQTAIRTLVRNEMKAHDTVGLSLALIEDQRVLWAEGFGFAHRERKLPARPDTLYAVGGLSKLLTATAVMQYVDERAIELDEPIRKALPEFSIRTRFLNAGPITVRQLLSNHSGLPAMYFHGMWTPKPEPLADFVTRLREVYVAAPPGIVHSPSFPGYDVLGRLIEVKCRQAFAPCMEERLLRPLGMARSSFVPDRSNTTMHYWSDKPQPSQTVRDTPAAGLTSSVTELARFVQMIFAEGKVGAQRLLSARSVREMLRVQNANVPLDLDNHVGLGWRLAGIHFPQARTVAWLNNESPFSRGRLVILPEHKLGVIVLTNSSGSSEVVSRVSERLLEMLLEQRRLPRVTKPAHTAVEPVTPPLRATDIIGEYASIIGRLTVTAVDDRYRVETLGKTIELFRTPEGLLVPEYRFLGLIPIPLSVLKEVKVTTARIGGRQLAIAYYRNAAFRFGERVAPVSLSVKWRRRLGEYRALNRDALLDLVKLGNVRLVYADGVLSFRYRVPGWLGLVVDVPVRPVSDTELVTEGTGWLMGETVQVIQRDGKEALSYSGYDYQQVGAPTR